MVYVGDNPGKDFLIKKHIPGIITMRVMREGGVYAKAPYAEDVREDYIIDDLQSIWEKIS